ncbi:MAG TPA: hypothetical protein VHC94_07680 [Nitrobacter sp.]|nr:hypothetical protein [Nitrobacter sp.]
MRPFGRTTEGQVAKRAAIFLFATTVVLFQSSAFSSSFDEGRLQRVQALKDQMIPGEVPAYYSPGYKQRARDLQKFIAGELEFYQRHLHVRLTLSLAVLDKRQWPLAERQLPYSVPSVTGTPPVAMVAANWGQAPDFFPREGEVDPAIVKSAVAHDVSWLEASHRAMDIVGGHELGHTLVDAYGIAPGTHWLNEMLASYALYAYVQADRPDLRWLWPVLKAVNRVNQPQRRTSLDEFEAQYMAILTKQPDNYGWYQAQFLNLVERVYAREGMGLFPKMHAAFPGGSYKRMALGTPETLRRLDAVDSEFRLWANEMTHKPRLH